MTRGNSISNLLSGKSRRAIRHGVPATPDRNDSSRVRRVDRPTQFRIEPSTILCCDEHLFGSARMSGGTQCRHDRPAKAPSSMSRVRDDPIVDEDAINLRRKSACGNGVACGQNARGRHRTGLGNFSSISGRKLGLAANLALARHHVAGWLDLPARRYQRAQLFRRTAKFEEDARSRLPGYFRLGRNRFTFAQ